MIRLIVSLSLIASCQGMLQCLHTSYMIDTHCLQLAFIDISLVVYVDSSRSNFKENHGSLIREHDIEPHSLHIYV
jgi:hypothetical protein